jgi:nucleoside 2-deoxyribosyltransferase
MSAGGSRPTLYFAAALFSARETWFNRTLSVALEQRGYPVILPQRDGFEFGALGRKLEAILPAEAVADMVQTIIYVLDIGRFLASSQVVVANLDEPLDDGVIVEICDARNRGIPVVGFRTDVRTPYGSSADALGGVHFFPAFQCDAFFRHHMPNKSTEESAHEWEQLLFLLERAIGMAMQATRHATRLPQKVDELAEQLFGGLGDLHSEQSLTTIAERCSHLQPALKALRPALVS